MSNILKGGFHPRRGLRAVPSPRRYEVASGYGTALFPGDAVVFQAATSGLNSGTIMAAGAGSGKILGVIAHVSYVATTGFRVYGPYIPASTTYTPTSRGSGNASYAYVWDDPSIEYIACVNVGTTAALNYAGIAQNMNLFTSTAGSTVYGRSGHQLDGTYQGTADAQFRIIEMLRSPFNDLTSQFQTVVCRINDGTDPFMSNAGI